MEESIEAWLDGATPDPTRLGIEPEARDIAKHTCLLGDDQLSYFPFPHNSKGIDLQFKGGLEQSISRNFFLFIYFFYFPHNIFF